MTTSKHPAPRQTATKKTATKKAVTRTAAKPVARTSGAGRAATPAVRTPMRSVVAKNNAKTPKVPVAKAGPPRSKDAAAHPHAGSTVTDSLKESVAIQWTRQSVQMTGKEFADLSGLKARAGRLGTRLKRGELLRVGLRHLSDLSDTDLLALLERTALPRRG